MTKSSAKSKRMLFQRPDGTPYDFWIQSNSPQLTKDILSKQIEEHGGRVTGFGEFPKHGFLLLDAMDPSPLYEVKTTFHKPVKTAGGAYERTNTAESTPLRHVLSSRFVSAVIEKGEWNRYDLLRWGFPVSLTREDSVDPKASVERYRKEIQLGIDPEMEHGWIWATNSAFDSYDPNYRFTEEFKIVDQAIASKDPKKNPKQFKAWLRGRVVAGCRLKWQLKVYLHDDIKREDQETLITSILENGGATCYDSTEADVILIGCRVDEIEDDMDVTDWITKNPRKAVDNNTRTLVKFTAWVRHCIEAGDWKLVDPKVEDVARAYRLFQNGKSTAKQKGKGRATLADVNWARQKRKRSSIGDLIEGDDQGSPTKKRRQQQDETVSTAKPGRYLPGSLSLGPGTGSTIRPKRVFDGVAVLNPQPSPLKHDENISSLVLGPKGDSRPEFTTTQRGGSKKLDDVIVIPVGEEHIDSHQHSRVSAGSVLTVDTAISSKVGNTTTNTNTTGTSKSARSVGPSLPPNARQVGRPSTSTGVDTEPSGVSRGALDQSVELSPKKSNQRTQAFQANLEADDLAGEVILSSFSSNRPKDASGLTGQPTKALSAEQSRTEFEQALVLCWRQMTELDYKPGVELIEDLLNRWPDVERELRQKATASHERKGKGRVSFHEPAAIDQDQDFVLETDYDEGGERRSQYKEPSVKKPLNLRAYSRNSHGSKTPDSVVSSDEEGSVERELRTSRTASPEKPAMAGTASKSPSAHKSSKLKNALSRNLPGASQGPSPPSVAKPSRSSRAEHVDSSADKSKGDLVQDSEENEELAPLPPTKTRSRRKRGDSVVSGNESTANENLPRRGRSASAAPPERTSRKAPVLARAAAGEASGRRKRASKSTGGKPATRKK